MKTKKNFGWAMAEGILKSVIRAFVIAGVAEIARETVEACVESRHGAATEVEPAVDEPADYDVQPTDIVVEFEELA